MNPILPAIAIGSTPLYKYGCQIGIATFEDRPDGYEETPSKDAANRFADKAAGAMAASGADLLYLELSPRGLDTASGKWRKFTFGLDSRWADDLMVALQPTCRRWPTVVYTGLWVPGNLSKFTGYLLGMGARWHGSDTSGSLAIDDPRMDAMDLSYRLGMPFLVEGPAYRTNPDLLKYGAIATSWWLGREWSGQLHGAFPITDHNPRQPRLAVYQEGKTNAVDVSWSGVGQQDCGKFIRYCHGRGITPTMAPWGLGKMADWETR